MKLLLVVLAAVRLAAAGDSAMDFLPANTRVVFGARVSGIVASPLFRDAGTGAQKLSEEWLKMVAITGFDPLRDIDEVVLASPADRQNASGLLILRGRFDLKRMSEGATLYRGIAMVGGGGKSMLALLDPSTVVAGDTASVRAAIDGQGQTVGLDKDLAERVRVLREHFDIWGTGKRAEGFVAPMAGTPKQLDSMDRFEFGVKLSEGLELGAEVHTRVPKDAEALAAVMSSVQAMMKDEHLAPKFDVQVKDGAVRVYLKLSEAEVKKALAEQQEPRNAPPVIVSSETTAPQTNRDTGQTTVFMLPGKK